MCQGNASADAYAGVVAQWSREWCVVAPPPRTDLWDTTAALVRGGARRAMMLALEVEPWEG
eukprot:8545786-Pyramimonas_sp.AAC.1